MRILGVDIGGSGIKAAPVDIKTGELLAERIRIATPQPADPEGIAEVVLQLAREFKWKGRIGCGFPAVIQHGTVRTATNIASQWIDRNVEQLFAEKTGLPVRVINDADAAGIAEMAFGAGRNEKGVVLLITVGTGLGSALFTKGCLVANTEFGHIQLKGDIAEKYAADSVRQAEGLSWKKWGKRLNRYFSEMEKLLYPDLIIVGGGVSKRWDKVSGEIDIKTRIVTAELLNEAGIVGAALGGV